MAVPTSAPIVDEGDLRRRIEADALWTVGAQALICPSFWQGAGVQTVTCNEWRLPAASELFAAPDGQPWWQRRLALGHHFEHIHARLLAAQPGTVIHALNLSIQGASRTLGEIDCLYSNADGDVVHREVAVKYFLGFRESSDARDWIGTGKVDRLDLKLQRLASHQTQLATHAQQQDAWPASLPFPVRREVLMLGAFFRHPTHSLWPEFMGVGAEGGFWCTTEEFVRLAGDTSMWARLDKPWWLSADHRRWAPHASAQKIATDVEALQHPTFVAGLASRDEPPLTGRGFVVPCGWERS